MSDAFFEKCIRRVEIQFQAENQNILGSAAKSWGLGLERSAQVGCVLAAYVVETVGTQEYTFTHEQFVARVEDSYGTEAADEVAAHL